MELILIYKAAENYLLTEIIKKKERDRQQEKKNRKKKKENGKNRKINQR